MIPYKLLDKNKELDTSTTNYIEAFADFSAKDKDMLNIECFFKTRNMRYKLAGLSYLDLIKSIFRQPTYFLKHWLYDLDFGPVDRLLRKIRFNKVLRYFNPKNLVILDVGCGRQGHFGWKIRKYTNLYIGLDRDIPNVQIQNVKFIKSPVEKMLKHLESESVDLIVTLAVIEHLKSPETFLRDCFKVLKLGGRLIITTPTPVSKPILEILSKLNIISGDEIEEHEIYFTKELLNNLAVSAGFVVEKYEKFLFGFNSITIVQKT
ncbi:class I SAM-dependent methyltransferase [Patescibacteria group bacterium]